MFRTALSFAIWHGLRLSKYEWVQQADRYLEHHVAMQTKIHYHDSLSADNL